MTETCRQCKAPLGRADRYCGICGDATSRLSWKGAEQEDWATTPGKVALTSARDSVTLAVRNEGVLPLFVGLSAETLRSPPPWLNTAVLRTFPCLLLGPGEERALRIPLVPLEIQKALLPLDINERGRVALSHTVRLVTTSPLARGAGAPAAQGLDILLAVARIPWLSPTGSHFPYLANQHLSGEGLVHVIELVNDSADTIELAELSVVDADELDDIQAVPANTMVFCPGALKGTRIEPGGRLALPLTLRDPGGHRPGVARWFNAEIQASVRSEVRDDDRPILAIVQGFVGPGPRLECRSKTVFSCERGFADWTERIELYNPAAVPVRILDVAIVDSAGQRLQGPDWLVVEPTTSGSLVPGDGVHTYVLKMHPEHRLQSEWEQEICTRRVRITHDGHPAGDSVEVTVQARLGKVCVASNVFLGIDFGTSNSTVSLVNEDEHEVLAIESPDAHVAKRDRMPSAMFYRDTVAGDRSEFDFGTRALRQGPIEPCNLVRGIKTLVNTDRQQDHVFLSGDGRYVHKETTDILAQFVAELHRRSNRTLNEFAALRRGSFRFPPQGQVRVPEAVFTHPIAITPSMFVALHAAAQATGLIRSEMTVEEFTRQRCIDEATAAIVAYVWLRALGRVEGPSSSTDHERVLCVDIGGGTMDVAAAEVANFESYVSGQGAQTVTIRLLASEGDGKFGGDHIDKILAFDFLKGMTDTARAAGFDLPVAVLGAVIEYSESFAGYRDWYERNSHLWPGLTDPDLHGMFRRMVALLAEVERQKIEFDGARDFTFRFTPSDLRAAGPVEKANEQIEVRLGAQAVSDRTLGELDARLSMIHKVCHRAGWQMGDVDTLLLTGQANYSRGFCERIESFVREDRFSESGSLFVVAPGRPEGFCAKSCVSLGAAVWGVSEASPQSWLVIDCHVTKQLTFDIQFRRGPGRYEAIPGLIRGAKYPARGVIALADGRSVTAFSLFREGKPFADVSVPQPSSRFEVEVRAPREVWVFAGNDTTPFRATCTET